MYFPFSQYIFLDMKGFSKRKNELKKDYVYTVPYTKTTLCMVQ